MSLATPSTSPSGTSSARPTSRTAARAPIVPKVMICATFSWPYLLHGVLDQLAAPVVGKVHVNIGHRDAARVEEALKDQVVRQRVEPRDAGAVRHHRAGARAAHVPPDVALFGVARQVPHDEEIVVEPHLVDDGQLIIQSLADLGVVRSRAVALAQSVLAQLAQE